MEDLHFLTFSHFGNPVWPDILQIMHDLIARLYLLGFSLVEGGIAYPFDQPKNLISDRQRAEAFLTSLFNSNAETGDNIYLRLYRFPCEITLSIRPNRSWVFSFEDDMFSVFDYQFNESNTIYFLDVISAALEIWPIYFGFASHYYSDFSPHFSDNSLLQIEELYEINFYSNWLAEEKFGLDRLLSIPAWKVQEVGGGILLVPSLKAIYKQNRQDFEQVAQHLGLTYAPPPFQMLEEDYDT